MVSRCVRTSESIGLQEEGAGTRTPTVSSPHPALIIWISPIWWNLIVKQKRGLQPEKRYLNRNVVLAAGNSCTNPRRRRSPGSAACVCSKSSRCWGAPHGPQRQSRGNNKELWQQITSARSENEARSQKSVLTCHKCLTREGRNQNNPEQLLPTEELLEDVWVSWRSDHGGSHPSIPGWL